jgi:hypothetical protein
MANQLGTDPNGKPITPAAIAQVNVQQANGFVDVQILDNSPIVRAINYYVNIADNPGFTNARVVNLGPSRNYHTILPNGTFYIQAQSQYPAGGPPSDPVSASAPVAITTSVIGALTLFPSQGSGTGGGGAGLTISRKV